jgi:hypothetical protein
MLNAVARLHGKTTHFVDGVLVSVGTACLVCFFAVQSARLAIASVLAAARTSSHTRSMPAT